MGILCKNRLLIISLTMASSGILTCGLALSDIFLPRGSAMVVLISIPLLAAIALAVLVAFAWACEMLDRRGYLRNPTRSGGEAKRRWQIISVRGPLLPFHSEGRPAVNTPKPLRPLVDYPVNLRGRAHFDGSRWASGSHGQ